VERKLSVREAERLVHDLLHPAKRSPLRRAHRAPAAATATGQRPRRRYLNSRHSRLGSFRIGPGARSRLRDAAVTEPGAGDASSSRLRSSR